MSDLLMNRLSAVRPTDMRQGAHDLLRALRLMLRTYLTREALLDLTPRQRADIGVSKSAALAEAARVPWDVRRAPGRQQRGVAAAVQRIVERARLRRLIGQWNVRESLDFVAVRKR